MESFRIKRWCRYWHFHLSGVLQNPQAHSNYLHITELLDEWFDTDCWEGELTLKERWKIVLGNLNKCSQEQLLLISKHCTSK